MTYEEIKHRMVCYGSGHPISFDGIDEVAERKCQCFAWVLEKYFKLRTEGVPVLDRSGRAVWYQCYCSGFDRPPMTIAIQANISFAHRLVSDLVRFGAKNFAAMVDAGEGLPDKHPCESHPMSPAPATNGGVKTPLPRPPARPVVRTRRKVAG